MDINGDIEDIETALAEYNLKNVDDLNKNIAALNARIERTRQKIIACNTSEEIAVDEPQTKQFKLNKMVFENEKALHNFVQNAKKMVQFSI